jgi:hypothetical protein
VAASVPPLVPAVVEELVAASVPPLVPAVVEELVAASVPLLVPAVVEELVAASVPPLVPAVVEELVAASVPLIVPAVVEELATACVLFLVFALLLLNFSPLFNSAFLFLVTIRMIAFSHVAVDAGKLKAIVLAHDEFSFKLPQYDSNSFRVKISFNSWKNAHMTLEKRSHTCVLYDVKRDAYLTISSRAPYLF